jgi:MerR family transcriptional regulator, heat shock protein HspR
MVAKKKIEIHPLRDDMAIYPIGVAAKLLDVHPRTLRIYEAEGLIQPDHQGSRRLFSPNDIKWISCIRSIIHDQGISIPGLKKLLHLAPCWEIAECPSEISSSCNASIDRSAPRIIREVGDKEAEKRAKQAQQKQKGQKTKKKKIESL